MKKYTFKFSADLHVNKYNHIWLSIEMGFMLILLMKKNEEELFYQLQWDRHSYFLIRSVFFVSKGNLFDVYCMYSFWKRGKMLLLRAMENI